MKGPAPLSTELAQRLHRFRLREVPKQVVAQAKPLLLDTIGAMLAASNRKYSAPRILVDFAKQLGGRPESSLVGQSFKTSCVNAALINGTSYNPPVKRNSKSSQNQDIQNKRF